MLFIKNNKYLRKLFCTQNCIDFKILLIVCILSIYSLFIIYSASNQNFSIINNRIFQIFFGMALMCVLAQIRPKNYEKYAHYFYIFCIFLLIMVKFYGKNINGARRWISILGIISFQPSELVKLALPLMLSKFLSRIHLPISSKNLFFYFCLVLLPTFLIGSQPDLGTAILLFFSGILILFLSGIRWITIFKLFILTILFIPIFWNFLMHEYQRHRIMILFNPEKDYLNTGYNIIQSKIAIGSGGIFGKGWQLGSQSKLSFLPEKHTDFIFSILAEELGLIGSISLVLIYTILIARIMIISINIDSLFGKIMTGGIMLIFCMYIIVNISMVMGLLPVVGIPLLLFSYGGSSFIVFLSSLGIIMSIHKNRDTLF